MFRDQKKNPVITCLAAVSLAVIIGLVCLRVFPILRCLAPANCQEVTYKVDGSTRSVFGPGVLGTSLAYKDELGDTINLATNLPWQTSFKAPRAQSLYISAHWDAHFYGSLRCQILVNGEVVAEDGKVVFEGVKRPDGTTVTCSHRP